MLSTLPIVPNDGIIGWTDILVQALRTGGKNCKVHLYANDYYPQFDSVVCSFVESVFGGYTSQDLGNPTNLGIDVTRRDVWIFPESSWIASGLGLPIISYGYWVDFDDPLTGGKRVLQAQRFFSPQTLFLAGQKIKFVLSWGGAQC